jgi:hypothetical protein
MEHIITTRINVAGSVKALAKGQEVKFPASVSENVVRTTCTRVKYATGSLFKVNRQKDGCHIVTRIA